jgi:hypothetical protein
MKNRASRASVVAGGPPRATQGAVWNEVADKSARMDVASPTGAMHDIYAGRRDRLAEFHAAIRLHDGQTGALVLIGGRAAVLDHVNRPEAFAALHAPLLQGYALDALEGRRPSTPPPNPARRPRRRSSSASWPRGRPSTTASASGATSASRRPAWPAPGSWPAPSSSSSRPSPTASRTPRATTHPAPASAAPPADGPPDVWILTPRGFYSVVANRDDPETVLVRARASEDLEQLAGEGPRDDDPSPDL